MSTSVFGLAWETGPEQPVLNNNKKYNNTNTISFTWLSTSPINTAKNGNFEVGACGTCGPMTHDPTIVMLKNVLKKWAHWHICFCCQAGQLCLISVWSHCFTTLFTVVCLVLMILFSWILFSLQCHKPDLHRIRKKVIQWILVNFALTRL